ncbi:ribonuclease HI [Burkholderia contaminans]|nr:ribonuclease HI [Burkholderia contaminans]
MPMNTVEIYTDGACHPNPGPGGWGALLRYGDKEKELFGGDPNTTNNRMELMGAISALEALKRPCDVTLCTDSKYVITCITNPRALWRRRLAKGKPAVNVDLLTRLEALCSLHSVRWQWVRGHNGHPENERADRLAARGMQPFIK